MPVVLLYLIYASHDLPETSHVRSRRAYHVLVGALVSSVVLDPLGFS